MDRVAYNDVKSLSVYTFTSKELEGRADLNRTELFPEGILMLCRLSFLKLGFQVEWGDGSDASRIEPDNVNKSRPVYQKITKKKIRLTIKRKIY